MIDWNKRVRMKNGVVPVLCSGTMPNGDYVGYAEGYGLLRWNVVGENTQLNGLSWNARSLDLENIPDPPLSDAERLAGIVKHRICRLERRANNGWGQSTGPDWKEWPDDGAPMDALDRVIRELDGEAK